jgi:hypothetical protein|tara:strand:- start:225 stop:383 length:159 start_codon:yes stop_codon:yes gene_type:complete
MEENNVDSKSATNLINDFKNFFKSLVNIEDGTNKTGTIKDIKANISMQGHTA